MMKILLPLMILLSLVLACSDTRRDLKSKTPTQDPPKIYYSKPTLENNSVFTLLHFEVTNFSSQNLEFLQIHASFYDKNGTLIRSENPYIERWQGLAPGQVSSAIVSTRVDSRITNYRLRFSAKGEDPFSTIDIDAIEIEPPKKQKKRK